MTARQKCSCSIGLFYVGLVFYPALAVVAGFLIYYFWQQEKKEVESWLATPRPSERSP
jgi:hypothetical protein